MCCFSHLRVIPDPRQPPAAQQPAEVCVSSSTAPSSLPLLPHPSRTLVLVKISKDWVTPPRSQCCPLTSSDTCPVGHFLSPGQSLPWLPIPDLTASSVPLWPLHCSAPRCGGAPGFRLPHSQGISPVVCFYRPSPYGRLPLHLLTMTLYLLTLTLSAIFVSPIYSDAMLQPSHVKLIIFSVENAFKVGGLWLRGTVLAKHAQGLGHAHACTHTHAHALTVPYPLNVAAHSTGTTAYWSLPS